MIDRLEKGEGEVLLGGVPLDSLSRATLAENVALVPQTPFLTADTVRRNICYGMKREVSPRGGPGGRAQGQHRRRHRKARRRL